MTKVEQGKRLPLGAIEVWTNVSTPSRSKIATPGSSLACLCEPANAPPPSISASVTARPGACRFTCWASPIDVADWSARAPRCHLLVTGPEWHLVFARPCQALFCRVADRSGLLQNFKGPPRRARAHHIRSADNAALGWHELDASQGLGPLALALPCTREAKARDMPVHRFAASGTGCTRPSWTILAIANSTNALTARGNCLRLR
jgi:hypothetical protein